MKDNATIIKMSRESLKGKWGLAIGTTVVYMLIIGGIQVIPKAGALGSLIITGPLGLGLALFALTIVRNGEAKLNQLFEGFQNFGTALGAYLLTTLFTILWLLLLIVPGIVAAISYAQTLYILADNPNIGPMEAIDKSKAMMDGYKMQYFTMLLRFVGLLLLCILTLGVGIFWLVPFMQVTAATFYEELKAAQAANQETQNAPAV